MRQTSIVNVRDNVGKRRHCSHLAPALQAPAGRNARIKWSEGRKTAKVRRKSTTIEGINRGTAEATPHHKLSERDYLDQQQQDEVNKYSRPLPRNEDWSSYDTFCTGVL